MSNSQQIDELATNSALTLAKPLAPEEIRAGDFVSLLHVFHDLPSFLWSNDAATQPREQLIRLCYLPESGGVPLKVISVCLPFVLVKQPGGQQQTLDIRKLRLARLDSKYAKAAWKLCKKKKS